MLIHRPRKGDAIGGFARSGDHDWSQQHLSHYVEGDLTSRARRRLERHAAECPDCGRGIRAIKALLRLMPGIALGGDIHEAAAFARVRAETTASPADTGARPEQ